MSKIKTIVFLESKEFGCEEFPDGDSVVLLEDAAKQTLKDGIERRVGWIVRRIENGFYLECGCCGHYHREDYRGDCRNDKERFSLDQLEALGIPDHCILELEYEDDF